VLAVTHLAQVAACADLHFVVSKAPRGKASQDVRPVAGEARVAEVARMLGGERLAPASPMHRNCSGRAAAAPPRSRSSRKPAR
jgi:DNA repair protein RecN (Recombination protein N)